MSEPTKPTWAEVRETWRKTNRTLDFLESALRGKAMPEMPENPLEDLFKGFGKGAK